MKTRYSITIAIILIAAALVYFFSYDTYNDPEEGIKAVSGIPLQFGDWKGVDQPMDELVYEILETKSIINRSYLSNTGKNVFLSVVYYTATKVDFHAPESCLAGQGTQISKTVRQIEIENNGKKIPLKVIQLLRREGLNDSLIFYFYKADDFIGENYIQLRLNLALNKFTSTGKNGSLIRFSTPITNDRLDQSAEILRGFIEELYPYIINAL